MIGNKVICKTKKEIELSCRVEDGLLEERSWLMKVAFIMPSCAKPHLNFDIFRIDIVRCSTPSAVLSNPQVFPVSNPPR